MNQDDVDVVKLVATVKRMLRQECSPETMHSYVERAINSKINAERREISVLMMELEIDTSDNNVLMSSRVGGLTGAVVAHTRKMMIQLVKERIEEGEE